MVAVALLLLAVAALFLTSPVSGQFWWSDAPRHALNGAFVHDLVRELPLDRFHQWAIDYYFQYPALTILFYPPLFPATEAVVFAVAGVSPWSAQLTVALFGVLAAVAAYGIGRRFFGRPAGLGASLLFLGLPEIALWGRQVMLELPVLALLLAAAWALLRHLDEGRPGPLYGAATLLVLALYTKLTALFLVPVAALVLLVVRGRDVLADRHVYVAAAAAGLALLPLAWMTLEFGAANVESVVRVQDAVTGRFSLANWTWYVQQLPGQTGWPVAGLAAVSALLAAAVPGWRLPRPGSALMVGWFGVGYLFFSSISLKESRFTVAILFPVAVAATSLVCRGLGRRWGGRMMPLLGAAVLAHTLLVHPVPFIDGYAEAADWIARNSPRDSVVLFSGLRDGSFIFNLRSHEGRTDLRVIRADKLLLRVAVRRSLGVDQVDVDEEELKETIARLGVRYVVADPTFWLDLENMRMLRRILESDQFEPVATVPVRANVPYAEEEVRIYRNLGEVAAQPEPFTMELEMIGETIRPSGD